MNDLDDRLTDLLARSAGAVDVHPDVDAVISGDHGDAPVVDLGRRPRDTRRLLALAAAVLVVVGLATVAIVGGQSDDRGRETAEAPAAPAGPARFPVLGHLPTELQGAHVEANEGEGSWLTDLGSTFRPEVTVARTALGRVAPNGDISDTIQVAAADEGLVGGTTPPPGAEVEDVGDGYQLMALEQEVWLYGPDRSVHAVGGAPAEAVVRALVDHVKATPDPVEVLEGVEPPTGLTVIAPPSPREAEKAEVLVPVGPPCDEPSRRMCDLPDTTVVVETGAGQPELAVMSVGGTITPVDIGGGRGVVATGEGFTRIAWTAPGGVNLALVAEYGVDEALAIARGVELVDEATWRDTYPEWDEDEEVPASGSDTTEAGSADTTEAQDGLTPTDDTAVPTETTEAVSSDTTEAQDGALPSTDHPLVGRPAPLVEGEALDAAFEVADPGEWLIVSLATPSCDSCVAMYDVLRAVYEDLATADRARVLSLFFEEVPGDSAATIQEHAVDWYVVSTSATAVEAWDMSELPATVFVDPEGIVRGVVQGPMTGVQIEETLTALGG